MSGESPRIAQATDAFHARFLAGRNVAILYGGHDAAIDRGRLEKAIRGALAAADERERPVAERLAAALDDLIVEVDSIGFGKRSGVFAYDKAVAWGRVVIADFARAHSTDGD